MSKLPFGYVKIHDREGVHVEQVPREAAAVRLCYELATKDNMGFKRMADELNRLGYRTKTATLFASQTVKMILSNPAMVGHAVFKGQGEPIVNENAYPAILTAEEWDKLQQRLTVRREGQHRGRTNSSDYLLAGVLRCGHCGGAMTGISYGPKLGKYRYYCCTNRKKAQALCDQQRSHRKEALEDAVLEHLGTYVDPERVRELLDAQGTEADTKGEAELTRVTARLAELEQGFLNDLDRVDRGILAEEQYLLRQRERDTEQNDLKPRKVDLEASVAAQRDLEAQAKAVPVKIGTFLEDFRGMGVREAKAILQGIIKCVNVFNDSTVELEFRA